VENVSTGQSHCLDFEWTDKQVAPDK